MYVKCKSIQDINTANNAYIFCVQFILQTAGSLILVSTTNYWILIPTFFTIILFHLLREVFIRTGRCVKRIDAVSRSPLFQHVNATINGSSTIRSSAAMQLLSDEFDAHQNRNVSAGFLFMACGRALALWLESVCVLYMAAIILLFLIYDKRKYRSCSSTNLERFK